MIEALVSSAGGEGEGALKRQKLKQSVSVRGIDEDFLKHQCKNKRLVSAVNHAKLLQRYKREV